MATQKDYVVVARALAAVRESYGKNWDPNLFRACDDNAKQIAHAFAQERPQFNAAKFLKAAGVQP